MYRGSQPGGGGRRGRRPTLEALPAPRRSSRLQGLPPPLPRASAGSATPRILAAPRRTDRAGLRSTPLPDDVGCGPRGPRVEHLASGHALRPRSGRAGGFDRELFRDDARRLQQERETEARRTEEARRNFERELERFHRQIQPVANGIDRERTQRPAIGRATPTARRDPMNAFYGPIRDDPPRRADRALTSGYPLPPPPTVGGGHWPTPSRVGGHRMMNPQADMLLGAAPMAGWEGTPMFLYEEEYEPPPPRRYREIRPRPPG